MGKRVGRIPVEVNISAPQDNHVPVFDLETRLWYTVPTSSFFPSFSSGSLTILGDLTVSGSINALSISSSLFGTSSWARNSISASYLSGSAAIVDNFTSSNDIRIKRITIGLGKTSGIDNIVIGSGSYLATSSYSGLAGDNNIAIGNKVLTGLVIGDNNVAVGYSALQNYTGSYSTAVGAYALWKSTSGRNTAFGQGVMPYLVTGSNNTGIGDAVMFYTINGTNNTGLGNAALRDFIEGEGNTAVGSGALYNLFVSGSRNTVIGFDTAAGIKTGSFNTIIGAKVQGLPDELYNNIILSDGQGNIRARYSSSIWTLSDSTVGNFTGSLLGTSSWSINALTASYAANVPATSSYALQAISSSYSVSSSFATSASQAENAISASYVLNAVSASFSTTSSNVLGGSSYYIPLWLGDTSLSSSVIYQNGGNIGIGNSLFLTVYGYRDLVINSNEPFLSGPNTYGGRLILQSAGSDVATFGVTTVEATIGTTTNKPLRVITNSLVRMSVLSNGYIGINKTSPSEQLDISGSVLITGSLRVTQGVTASLFGTASWANNSISASFATSTSYSLSASQAQNATTASYVLNAVSTSFASTSSLPLQGVVTASVAGSTITFTKGDSSTFNVTITTATAETASYVSSSNVDGPYGKNSILSASYAVSASQADNAITASYVLNAMSASYALSASQADNATTASYVLNAISASFATTASYAVSASQANNATSASYALSASQAENAVTASLAQSAFDILVYVKNSSGAQINKGTVVRIIGAVGDNPLIATASYTDDNNSANTLGITYENIANDGFGYVITEGTLKGIDTSTPGWTAGQLIYLGLNGTITGSAPVAPLHAVRLGEVLRVQLNNGSIYVRIDNGYEIGELHDVRDTSTTGSYGDLLVKSGSIWINSKQLTGSYGLTGSLTATSFTGSLQGTASWANNAISSSYALSASNAQTASYVLNAISASYTLSASQAQNAVTASYILNAVSASFASTASSADNFTVRGTLTAQTIVVQTITSSTDFVTGSTRFGTLLSNTHQFTGSVGITGSLNVVGAGITGSLFGTASWANNAISSSYPIAILGSTIYSPISANNIGFSSNNSIFLGDSAGYNATNAGGSTFIGLQVGQNATNAYQSNFLGAYAGDSALNSDNSNFLGFTAGQNATNANQSNFLGVTAGQNATNANQSNFLGTNAGGSAIDANNSNFLGSYAGYQAVSASYSTLIGYQAGYASSPALTIKSNNIIIGTNITLGAGRQDSINIGGLIFGTGSYSNISTQSSGSANGRIGINQPFPIYSLDVSGSGNYTNGLTITGSLTVITGSAIELQVTNTGVKIGNIITDTHTITGSLGVSGSVTATNFTGSLFGTSSWAVSASQAITASYVLNAVSASFATSASQAQNAVTASYILNAVSASFATTASNVLGGTTNYIPLWNTDTSLSSSIIYQSGSNIGIGTNIPSVKLEVSGSGRISGPIQSQTFNSGLGVSTTNLTAFLIQPTEYSTSTSQRLDGLVSTPSLIASAGSSTVVGGRFEPIGERTNTSATVSVTAVRAVAYRNSSTTPSGLSIGPLIGVQSIVGHWVSQSVSANTANVYGIYSLVTGQKAVISNAYNLYGALNLGTDASATFGTVTNYYGIYSTATLGRSDGTTNAAITNYYELYLNGATVFTNGTITNRWGIYQSGSLHKNYFAANSLFGSTNDLLSYKVQISGGLYVADNVILAASGAYVGIGTTSPNAHLDVSGSAIISGSLTVVQGITGSLFGTASWANNSISTSFAASASQAQNSVTASYVLNAISASYSLNSTSASYALTSSLPLLGIVSASAVNTTITFTRGDNTTFNVVISQSGSVDSASFATSASQAQNAVTASYILNAVSASFATSASQAQNATTASYVLNAVSASFATSASQAQNAISSSFPITVSGSTLRSVSPQGGFAASTNNSIFLGDSAGDGAISASFSNFLGFNAGNDARNAAYSNFFGLYAGINADNATYSNFFGTQAGYNATNANNSVFIGTNAGTYADQASYSTLIGYNAGYNTLLETGFSIGSNNIIIGTNITLAIGRKDSINIGGIIFGTGSYSTTTGDPFEGSANGRIGINQPFPTFNLDVSGSGRYTNGLQITGSLNAPIITGSLFGTASWANNAISASNARTASYVLNAVSSSYALTASYVLNAVSSSFATNATTAATASYSNNLVVGSTISIDATLTDYATVASSVVGSNNLFTQATGSYTSAFFKYTVTTGSNSRAGEVVAVWNGTSVQFYDNSTVDIGNTTAVTSSATIVGGDLQFNIQTNTSGWRIKSLATFM